MCINILHVQLAFQTILLTDGVSSFAVFVYANTIPILMTPLRQVGFDAGDQFKSTTILPYNVNESNVDVISIEMVFRIDGMLHSTHLSCIIHM